MSLARVRRRFHTLRSLQVLRRENSTTLSRTLIFSLISSAALLVASGQPRPTPLLLAQNLPVPIGDVVRTAEFQQKIALAMDKRRELDARARQQQQQQQFALKFNQLVDAVANFAKVYNQGKGSVWPQREADKLRKAMRQIQQADKALRDDLCTAPPQTGPSAAGEITR